ncbi:hypothetical protein SKAU_G00415410 [Synaphobranchus kaupii]|uniref:Uncharacterized protein n=1 Tax=Synaphobranchus kaupii TaxID=118154 RepID=A0A9Q1E7A2_SYNKA|nr:hypothetical protein SKAU_G00415410 [Synaphobranchus kaupii]
MAESVIQRAAKAKARIEPTLPDSPPQYQDVNPLPSNLSDPLSEPGQIEPKQVNLQMLMGEVPTPVTLRGQMTFQGTLAEENQTSGQRQSSACGMLQEEEQQQALEEEKASNEGEASRVPIPRPRLRKSRSDQGAKRKECPEDFYCNGATGREYLEVVKQAEEAYDKLSLSIEGPKERPQRIKKVPRRYSTVYSVIHNTRKSRKNTKHTSDSSQDEEEGKTTLGRVSFQAPLQLLP